MTKSIKSIFATCLFLLAAIHNQAQVGIGTTSPTNSAKLDISASDKGVLIPRVALTAFNAQSPIVGTMAPSLLVYNTASGNGVTPGFYYWSGSAWVRLAVSNEVVNSIGDISSTPNSKGASITSGVLSLTAADATNGGVITTSNQTFSGTKTFSSDIFVNGVRIGRGGGNNEQNVAIGADALASGTGKRNTAVGYGAMRQYSGTSFDNNTSVGYWNMPSLTIGNGNTSVGAESMLNLSSGTQNTSIGNQSLINTTGSENVGVGKSSGAANTTGSQNTFIGTNTNAGANNLSNATALGYGASVAANNSIQLGNTNVTNVNTSGTITANGFVKSGGTSAQFLKADGSIDAMTYQSSNTNLTSIANLANGAGFLKNNGSGTLSYTNPSVSEVTGMGTNVATFLATPSSANFAAATTDETGSGALVFATSPSLTTPSLGVATATSINNLTIGRGAANLGGNIVLGESVLSSNTTGQNNTAIGYEAMKLNTLGWSNTALGQSALNKNLSGNNSVAIGYQALFNNTASDNDALGYQAMYSNAGGTRNVSIGQKSLNKNTLGNNNTVLGFTALPEKSTGSDNIAIGYYAGRTTADGTTLLTEINNSILIGADTRANANNETNQIVIGHGAIGAGSNTIRLGNTLITAVNTSGTITANGFVKSGGTSSQFLMANGTATSSPSLSGATGLSLTTGVTGTLPVANGGTGATTLTGVLIGNGTSAVTAVSPGTSGNVLVSNGSSWTSAASLVPSGVISAFAGSTAPTGYLLCDGSAVSRTTYAELFAVIGTTYGSGDGSTTFNLPDLRSRVIVGAGQGTGLTNRLRGSTGGSETHTLTVNEIPAHNHSVNDPGHTHTSRIGLDDKNLTNNAGQAPPGDATSDIKDGYATTSNTTGISIQNTGGGQSFNIMQPFIVLNYIIKF